MGGADDRAQRPKGPSQPPGSNATGRAHHGLRLERERFGRGISQASVPRGPPRSPPGDLNTREDFSTNRHASQSGPSLRSSASVRTRIVDWFTRQVIVSANIGESHGRTRQETTSLSVKCMVLTAIPAIAASGIRSPPGGRSGALRWLSLTCSVADFVIVHCLRERAALSPGHYKARSLAAPLGGPPEVIPLRVGAVGQSHRECVLEPGRIWEGSDRVGTMEECGLGTMRPARQGSLTNLIEHQRDAARGG